MVLVRWHGHACFEIVTKEGISIVVDPHDGYSIGIKPPTAKADLVLITHDHFDHNAYGVVAKPEARILRSFVGETTFRDIKIIGVQAYHDEFKGKRRGTVTLYRIDVEGLSLVHLGDLGHELDPPYAEKLGNADVLFVPVGGTFTIDAVKAWSVVKTLNPRIVIPMHYWIRGMNLPLKPVDDFVARAEAPWKVVRVDRNEIEITKEKPEPYTVIVLAPP